jgi:hypothetical protein
MSIEAMKQALDYMQSDLAGRIKKKPHAIASLRQAIEQYEKQKPWVWQQAPIKTQWGHDMVVAGRAIDKDHTVIIYCERDQTARVEAMLSAQPKREWVSLTDAEIEEFDYYARDLVMDIEKALKERNA